MAVQKVGYSVDLLDYSMVEMLAGTMVDLWVVKMVVRMAELTDN